MTVAQLRDQLAAFDGEREVLVTVEFDDDDVLVGVPYLVQEKMNADIAEKLIYIECEQE